MKRFLMLVGVAAVAAAMYVAASPASQQSKFATEKQFLALQKKVTSQGKTIKQLKQLAVLEGTFIVDCAKTRGPDRSVRRRQRDSRPRATTTRSRPAQRRTFLTTALDVTDPAQDTGALFITGGDASCGTPGQRHRATARRGEGRSPRAERDGEPLVVHGPPLKLN